MDAAVTRLMDRAYVLSERTRDTKGWWVSDPIGDTGVLLPDPTLS